MVLSSCKRGKPARGLCGAPYRPRESRPAPNAAAGLDCTQNSTSETIGHAQAQGMKACAHVGDCGGRPRVRHGVAGGGADERDILREPAEIGETVLGANLPVRAECGLD